jgi:hypothetical protein
MSWILIVWMFNGTATALPMPFSTLVSCEQAGSTWDNASGRVHHHVCVPRQ